jgi:molybdate transport system substrate-binding protein
MFRILFFAILLLTMTVQPSSARSAPTLVVFAAASLTDALTEISKRYQGEGHGAVLASFASSSDLARQIEQGAPADLFISADEQWADYLDQRGLLDRPSRITLLRNELVLIAGAEQPGGLTISQDCPLAAALGQGRLALGDPDHVPAGIYAKAALQSLGVWQQLEPRLARAASVRGALLFVERGECPFGIVYRSDALVSAKVRLVGIFPPGSHPPILYPAAAISDRKTPETLAFLQYLQSTEAAAIFRRFGFEMGV